MPRGAYGGVLYWLLFLALLVWAINRDLHPASPPAYAESTGEAEQDRHPSNDQVGESKPLIGGVTLLDIATLILAGSTVALWLVTRRGIENQIKDTRILQRAYIAVELGGIREFDSRDGRIACDIIMKNAGNLPARNVRWAIYKGYSSNPEREKFPIRESTMVKRGIVIAPRGDVRKGTRPTYRTRFDRIRNDALPGKAWLYVWGRVAYHDGFTAGRSIDFCHRYNLHGASGYEIPATNGRHHEFGNSTDEDTPPPPATS